MKTKVYSYKKCSTCVKALRYLDQQGVSFDSRDIVEEPPTKTDLEIVLKSYNGDLRRLFNTSGQVYRELKLKDRMNDMTKTEALKLLSQNGKLVKRPFVVKGKKGLVGFKEAEWKSFF